MHLLLSVVLVVGGGCVSCASCLGVGVGGVTGVVPIHINILTRVMNYKMCFLFVQLGTNGC